MKFVLQPLKTVYSESFIAPSWGNEQGNWVGQKKRMKKKRKEVHGHPLFVFHTVFQTLVHLQLYLGVLWSVGSRIFEGQKIKNKNKIRPPAPIFFPVPDDKLKINFTWPKAYSIQTN